MKYLENKKLILVLILLLASLLRLPLLDQLPMGITIDEAGQGYSAYSILKTGKDEWGDFLPLNPRGFGDYKPPIFMYLLVPSIAIFGLTSEAVRIPSAVAGILTVWIFYFLMKSLFKSSNLALVASFLLAISPWHVYYSRLGWESNIGLMFFCLGIWLFIRAFERPTSLIFSVVSLGFSTLSYHSFKLLVPMMVLGLIVIYRKEIKRLNKKVVISSVCLGLVFLLILGYGFIFSGAGRRAADQSLIKEENLMQLRQNQFEDKLPQPLNRIVNNKYQFLISKVADNYLGYYSLSFLFSPHRSDSSVLNFPGQGLFYIWQLPFLILGLFYFMKTKSKSVAIIGLWLVLAPIPASLTQDYMHAGRAQALFPALTILTAAGMWFLFQILKNNSQKKIAITAFVLLVVCSLILRIDNYLFHTFSQQHGGLVQGYKEITDYVEANKSGYDKVVFTKAHSEPQAFIAFYSKMNPELFQKGSFSWKSFEDKGFRFLDMTDYKLGKYEFRNVDINRDRNEKNALIITTSENIPSNIVPRFIVKNEGGKIMFEAFDTNEIPE